MIAKYNQGGQNCLKKLKIKNETFIFINVAPYSHCEVWGRYQVSLSGTQHHLKLFRLRIFKNEAQGVGNNLKKRNTKNLTESFKILPNPYFKTQ